MKIKNKITAFYQKYKRKMLGAAGLIFAFVLFSFMLIQHKSKGYIHSDVSNLTYSTAGLVLGTSPYLRSGFRNPYFDSRIEAATALYEAKKVQYLIVSGDNGTKAYNEPENMKQALMDNGIPEEVIVLDYAGFRTLDSVVRAKKIFGQESIIIVTQPFHAPRAIFLARAKGLSAQAFLAKEAPFHNNSKTQWREYLARTKAVLDIIIGVKPRYLGEKIDLPTISQK